MIWAFEPQKDLTVLELALIVSKVRGGDWRRIDFSGTPLGHPPDEVLRHFRHVDPETRIIPKDRSWYDWFLGDAK